jgi:20S proteasome subunit alpha 6
LFAALFVILFSYKDCISKQVLIMKAFSTNSTKQVFFRRKALAFVDIWRLYVYRILTLNFCCMSCLSPIFRKPCFFLAMNKNQYDYDVTIWSPQGRLHQVEYAMEAVKLGSACVGLKSKTHALVCAVKRSPSELSSYQRKIFKIDDHVGIAISGLTADARSLAKYMRNECLNHRFVYESPLPVNRLVTQVADKSQVHTQRYGRRPYGVGLLVVGCDQNGTHLYETCPSGNFYAWKTQAIGARAQSAKTYLEKNYTHFENATAEELIKHGLLALREAISHKEGDKEPEPLGVKNCSVGIVGLEGTYRVFTILDDAKLEPFIQEINTA